MSRSNQPLFGTEYKKVSPQSQDACSPTANHKFPVRRSVRQKNSPMMAAPSCSNFDFTLIPQVDRAEGEREHKGRGPKTDTRGPK